MAGYNYYSPNYVNAYGGYYPQTFQPVTQAPPAVQTQAIPPVTPTYPTTSNQNSIIWVSGEKEASMYPLAPNNAVTLWSQSEPVVYLKQADATGKPTMKVYDLVERIETAPAASVVSEDKLSDYVTKDELGKIMSAVKSVDELVSGIKSDVETMKGDLYGVAGRKKTSRKSAEVEDE